MAKMIKRLSAGFVIPAQPVLALKTLSGADWAHEIKHWLPNCRAPRQSHGRLYSLQGRATGGNRGCARTYQGQELHD
jgi:hypothetical protein